MKRNIILYTAARLFAERGFANTPTLLLAQEAGVAEGTIFRHFHTKDEIFFVIIENVTNQLMAHIREQLEMSQRACGLDAMLSIARVFCLFVSKNRMEFGLVFRDATARFGNEEDRAFRCIKDMYVQMTELARETLVRGQKDASVNSALNATDTAVLLVGMLTGVLRALHFGLAEREDGIRSILPSLLQDMTLMLSPSQKDGKSS